MTRAARVARGGQRSLFSGYLALQASLATIWWLSLASSPTVRSWFELVPDKRQALDSFLFADLVMFVGASIVSAWGVWRQAPWAVPLTAFTAGGITYATLYLIGWVAIAGGAPAGVLPMAVSTIATSFVAYRVWQASTRPGTRQGT